MGSGSGGVVGAADSFMAKWYRDKTERSWLYHAADDAKNGDKRRGLGGAAVLMQLPTSAETK